ncbi:MAG: CHAT domain-containing protein [Ardenticatenaceae bacterium]|nr:CHAT domain-containing protein [Ardenticatenaceae bacterium]
MVAYQPWCDYLGAVLNNEKDRDWAKAETVFQTLLERGVDDRLASRVRLALGNTCYYQGRWAEAIAVYQQITDLEDPLTQIKVWKQIAVAAHNGFTRSDFDIETLYEAVSWCQKALAALKAVPATTGQETEVTWLEGSIWNTLGIIYLNLGQFKEAVACYEKDLAFCEALSDTHGMGLTYGNLGEVYQRQGNFSAALQAYEKALPLIRQHRNTYDETEALANLGYLHQEMGQWETAVSYYDQAITLIEHLRSGASTEAARADFMTTVSDIYAHAVLTCVQIGRFAQAFNYVEQARARAFLDVALTGSPDLSGRVVAETLDLTAVQSTLPPNTLLLEYFTTGLEEIRLGSRASQSGVRRHRFPPAKTLFFAISRNEMHVYDCNLSPNDLRPQQLDSVVERHFLESAIRRVLYDTLLAPAAAQLPGKQRLYLVPHGPLHYIPFAALFPQTSPTLVYAPSATFLFQARSPHHAASAKECLALGYNGEAEQPLRFAAAEARQVVQQLGGTALADDRPKKQTLLQQAAHYRWLHFSCHGDFQPDDPLASALYLSPQERLTVQEVLERLQLRSDLVTLSACESGLSRVRRGDDLVGFVRAFAHAGATAVLATLWRVDERSTQILMLKFYEAVAAGVDFATALQQAQHYLRTLTAREITAVLRHILATEEPASGQQASSTDLLAPISLAKGGSLSEKAYANEDALLFADPYYWAPFILVSGAA